MPERILLIGSGGREHALAHSLRNSASCDWLWCAPGNPGIARVAEIVDVDVNDSDAVALWCKSHDVSFVVIGPEQPLALGVADSLRSKGIDVFGPSKRAAALETSKGFAKDFMLRHNIPTAPFKKFAITGIGSLHGNLSSEEWLNDVSSEALNYLENHDLPVVIKYDGLAAGKGVVVAETHDDAKRALKDMARGTFGDAGIVIESFLRGREASVFAVCDGADYVVLAPSQDHKRIGEGNTGKNTGGMGAYAPVGWFDDSMLRKVINNVIEPTVAGMASEGNPFVGCLYCGLMIDDSGNPFVVEYNARFGDPETQAVLAVLDADFAALLASAARGAVDTSAVKSTARGVAVNVVLASAGYPDAYEKGHVITGIEEAEQDPCIRVFQAGTKRRGGETVTDGGRVLGVTAVADTLDEARRNAYSACKIIDFKGKYYRSDIGAVV
ncbi:MAG: phosphoribosylamine--glycine ligase [Ignavibacteria bacterium]|nr:phosphoribosylamine--glycine ligase [Ignavibacteria bacterium]